MSVFGMYNITLCIRTWCEVSNFAWHRYETWQGNITEIVPPKFTDWNRPCLTSLRKHIDKLNKR